MVHGYMVVAEKLAGLVGKKGVATKQFDIKREEAGAKYGPDTASDGLREEDYSPAPLPVQEQSGSSPRRRSSGKQKQRHTGFCM